jgi:hypothetical protein
MESILYILGIIIVGLVTWFWAKARLQGIHAKQMADLQMSYSNQI